MTDEDERVRKTAYISSEHDKYMKETDKNFSLWIRNKIEEAMNKDGYEVET